MAQQMCQERTRKGTPCTRKAAYALKADGSGMKLCGQHLNAAGFGIPYAELPKED